VRLRTETIAVDANRAGGSAADADFRAANADQLQPV